MLLLPPNHQGRSYLRTTKHGGSSPSHASWPRSLSDQKRRHRQVKWLRTAGAFFDIADWETKPFTPEDLRDRFDEICDWDSETVFPDDEKADGKPSPQMQQILSKL